MAVIIDSLEQIKSAFDGADVPRKNIALRKAHDRIAQLEAALDSIRRLPLGTAQCPGEPFFKAVSIADAALANK